MAFFRRSRKDDVDVESVLANLHRIAHVATTHLRNVIDLRHSEPPGEAPRDAEDDAPARTTRARR